jgi:alkylation response protein AidB-like acyl-CoA dehydrogenase
MTSAGNLNWMLPTESDQDRPGDPSRLFAEIEALGPEIVAQAADAEEARRISAPIMDRLGAAGLNRASVPRSHGGLELDLPDLVELVQRLARLDASVGWIGATRVLMPIGLALLPRGRLDALLRSGPDVLMNACNQPGGIAEATPGGWRVSGRWPFASGCEESQWSILNCVLIKDGQPLPGPAAGAPAMRMMLVPRSAVEIEDTWRAMGLRATASHHVVVKDALLPESDGVDLATARPSLTGPLYRGLMQTVELLHCPVALGIAEGALADLLAMAQSGRRQLGAATTLKESEIFQYELGQAHAELRAAQALADAETRRLWTEALDGSLSGGMPQPAIVQSTIWVTQACLRVVRTCFALAGAAAIYDTSPLQRRLRDMEAAAQHGLLHRRHFVEAGRSLLAPAGALPA